MKKSGLLIVLFSLTLFSANKAFAGNEIVDNFANSGINSNLISLFQQDDTLYTTVDEMPRFPGCEDKKTVSEKMSCSEKKLEEFIKNNLKYPESAKRAGVKGKVYVQFIVDKSGAVTDKKVIRGIGGGCDEESLRIIGLMPKWIPGKLKGNIVRVRIALPIDFKLEQ